LSIAAAGDRVGVALVEIGEDEAGQRLDNFLLARLKGVPKSRVYRLLRKGVVRVNTGRARPEYRLAAGDRVRIPPVRLDPAAPTPPAGRAAGQRLESSVLHEGAT
jgi:23S rRNA pseudouridine955/2504/2580 synthase